MGDRKKSKSTKDRSSKQGAETLQSGHGNLFVKSKFDQPETGLQMQEEAEQQKDLPSKKSKKQKSSRLRGKNVIKLKSHKFEVGTKYEGEISASLSFLSKEANESVGKSIPTIPKEIDTEILDKQGEIAGVPTKLEGPKLKSGLQSRAQYEFPKQSGRRFSKDACFGVIKTSALDLIGVKSTFKLPKEYGTFALSAKIFAEGPEAAIGFNEAKWKAFSVKFRVTGTWESEDKSIKADIYADVSLSPTKVEVARSLAKVIKKVAPESVLLRKVQGNILRNVLKNALEVEKQLIDDQLKSLYHVGDTAVKTYVNRVSKEKSKKEAIKLLTKNLSGLSKEGAERLVEHAAKNSIKDIDDLVKVSRMSQRALDRSLRTNKIFYKKQAIKKLRRESARYAREIADVSTRQAAEVLEQVAKRQKKEAMEEMWEKIAKESAEKILKDGGKKLSKEAKEEAIEKIAKKILKEGAEEVMKDGGEQLAKEIGEKAAKEIAEKLVKESGEKLAKEVGERIMKQALKEGAKKLGLKLALKLVPGLNIVMLVWDIAEISYGIYKIYKAHNDPDKDKKVMGGTGKKEPKNPNNIAPSSKEKQVKAETSNGNVSTKTKALLEKSPTNVQKIWLAVTIGKGNNQPLTEAQMKRFLALIPPDISDEQTETLLKKASSEEVDFETMVTSLEKALGKTPIDPKGTKESEEIGKGKKRGGKEKTNEEEENTGEEGIPTYSAKELETRDFQPTKKQIKFNYDITYAPSNASVDQQVKIDLIAQYGSHSTRITGIEAVVVAVYHLNEQERVVNSTEATYVETFYKIKKNTTVPFDKLRIETQLPAGVELRDKISLQ